MILVWDVTFFSVSFLFSTCSSLSLFSSFFLSPYSSGFYL